MPKESPPGPDFSLSELESIARAEARKSRGLTPNGGSRWTAEDIAFSVSILDAEMRSRAFRRAWNRGMTKPQARLWLAKALHNRLLDHAKHVGRILLLDDLALDAIPAADGQRKRLYRGDRTILVERVLTRLTEAERVAAGDYLRGRRNLARRPSSGRTARMPAPRTLGRRKARLRQILRTVAEEADLSRNEAMDLLLGLTAKLAGRGEP